MIHTKCNPPAPAAPRRQRLEGRRPRRGARNLPMGERARAPPLLLSRRVKLPRQ